MRDNYSQSVVVDGRQHVISIELRVETECIWITEVKTPVEIRSQGYARRTLEALIADADIENFNDPSTDPAQYVNKPTKSMGKTSDTKAPAASRKTSEPTRSASKPPRRV